MKKVLLIASLLIAITCYAQLKIGSGQIVAVASDIAVPAQWTNVNTWVRSVTIQGKKAERTTNTSVVFIGPLSTNDKLSFEVAPGGQAVLEAPPGTLINLADWYVDSVTAGDGVVLIYR